MSVRELMRSFRLFFILVVFNQSAALTRADRIYTFRSMVDLIAAADDNPQVGAVSVLSNQRRTFGLAYGIYPSIFMSSKGPHLDVQVSYAFGLNRVAGSELDLGSESQTLEGTVNAALTRNLKMKFSESYVHSPDFLTFNLSRGIVSVPEGFFPRSDIVALRRNSHLNTASINFDYSRKPKSTLSFGFGHLIRNYESNPLFSGHLSDQKAYIGNFLYVRKINQRTSWNWGYSIYQYDFRDFNGARTHSVDIGVNGQVSKTLTASLSLGPSYTKSVSATSHFAGYNAALRITKSFENDRITLGYHRRNGASFGIGSISDTQDLDLSYSRPLGRRTSLNGVVLLYDARQRLGNPVESRGATASLILNLLLSNHWALSLGGSYQKQKGTEIFDLERKRLFISVRMALPEFLRFEK